jgi:phosphatidylglycerophosphate synthase
LTAAIREETRKGPPPERPRRARELQDPLNHYLYHPLAWQLALRLARTPLTPNMVSVIGAFFVIGAAVVYAQPWWPVSALLGLLLHMTWHVVDGADGDLARITGKTSPTGEMVDGLCDYLSHIVLYFVLLWLLLPQIGWIAWPIMVVAGLSHIIQSNHVEVQRRQYQWWVYGTPWLRNTHEEGSETAKSGFGALVSFYLRLASGMTPHGLKIDAAVEKAMAQDHTALERIRAAVRAEAPPLLFLCKLLGPNPRAIVLGLSMLAGSPLYYFIYQAVVLNLLLVVSVVRHNQAAERIAARIGA